MSGRKEPINAPPGGVKPPPPPPPPPPAMDARDRNSPDSVHRCHWPECRRVVPPKLWGCRQHWFALPKPIRDRIWRAYRPGQEITKDPSPAYREAARAARAFAKAKNLEAGANGKHPYYSGELF